MARRAAGTALLLELPDVRPGRERALPSPAHHHGANVAGSGGVEGRERRLQFDEEVARDEVQRRVHELEVRDPPELELDQAAHEPAHDAAPKSAARPIGPVA